MTIDRQQQAINLEQADQAAQRNFSTDALESPVAGCPARESQIFIVPTRYGLVEDAVEDGCLQPGYHTRSHPMALRRLRTGYLYIWQGGGPLKRYAITPNSQLAEQPLSAPHEEVNTAQQVGLAFDKHLALDILYTEIPLPAAIYTLLEQSVGERGRRMQQINLPQVAVELEATHCPTLDKAEQLIAELIPAVRERIMAYDFRANPEGYKQSQQAVARHMQKHPSPERVQAHIHTTLWLQEHQRVSGSIKEDIPHRPGYWSSEPWSTQGTDAWFSRARQQAGSLHAVLVAVDDILGMLRDLNHEQARTTEIEEEWNELNGHKGLMAGFINSLREEDGAELAGIISYRYREQDMQLTPEQGELLLQAQRDLQPTLAEETDINQNLRRTHGHAAADARLRDVHARQQQIYQPIRSFIPAQLHGHIQGVVMNYRASKQRNMSDSRSGAQVAERVRLAEMENWISNVASPHRDWLAHRRHALFQDTQTLLAQHDKGSWFADYADRTHCEWLSELGFNTLSELCISGPGVMIATDLLRNPTPGKPLSLVASAFTPELSELVGLSERLAEIEGVLSANNQELAGTLIGRLAGTEKLSWLQSLGGADGHDWGRAMSRLAAAFAELEAEHLKEASAPAAIQHFPKPLLSLMLVLKVSGDFALKSTQTGYQLSGPAGKAVWDWSNQAADRLRLGLVRQLEPVQALNAYGGALSLAALLLHGINLVALRSRDELREHNLERRMEHLNATLNIAAALSAVIQNASYARGVIEKGFFGVRLPLVTALGFVTGFFAASAGFSDLVKLVSEQRKSTSHWSTDEWGRLLRGSGHTALAGTYASMGGYATYMHLVGRWDTARATSWFIRTTSLVGWGVLLIEGLYLAWRHFTHRTEMQRFLEECCWGNKRRWTDTEEDQAKEFHALINMLFNPQLKVKTRLVTRTRGNHDSLRAVPSKLTLVLPGADPETTRLGITLVAVGLNQSVREITSLWEESLECRWLPIEEGMGLKLTGKVAELSEKEHLEVRVLYHSPLALMIGAVGEASPVVGGNMGARYLVKGGQITQHANEDGPLPSDKLLIEQPISRGKLQPEKKA
ncbi:toxin VasX [Pseudomonas sp. FME51]|uniref:toxin VasX n=1 Tax=Pseudomonas sp. FME51 TaxID=2742609 RepID=UPI0018670E75|nr:toxin VasX [Pseudomonas sp. FME51]